MTFVSTARGRFFFILINMRSAVCEGAYAFSQRERRDWRLTVFFFRTLQSFPNL